MIRTMVVNNHGSHEDAADVFQEAMIVLYEKVTLENFELQCLLKTYLFSVCRNIWLKKLQRNRRFQWSPENLENTVAVEDDLNRHENLQRNFSLMEKAMENLGEPCRSLLEAYYIRKKLMTEIAAEFGYTNADNAKTQKYKCLVRLKKLFFTDYKTT